MILVGSSLINSGQSVVMKKSNLITRSPLDSMAQTPGLTISLRQFGNGFKLLMAAKATLALKAGE